MNHFGGKPFFSNRQQVKIKWRKSRNPRCKKFALKCDKMKINKLFILFHFSWAVNWKVGWEENLSLLIWVKEAKLYDRLLHDQSSKEGERGSLPMSNLILKRLFSTSSARRSVLLLKEFRFIFECLKATKDEQPQERFRSSWSLKLRKNPMIHGKHSDSLKYYKTIISGSINGLSAEFRN